jgi:DNA adenine methylase
MIRLNKEGIKMPVTLSPLRYPGGKTQIAPFVDALLEHNGWVGGTYCEPFAGGCGIAWHLLLNGRVERVVINDLNPAIFSFWHSVLNNVDGLCERIEETPVTIDEWHRQKKVLTKNEISLDLGYAALFLNRVNRSGILTAGVIGGKAQSGDYKLDCRFNKTDIISKIQAIASRNEQVVLTNLDAKEFLTDVVEDIDGNTFINIDPPYYNKGKQLYQNFFEHQDHITLFDAIKRLTKPWMVTYDNTPEIAEIYAEFNPEPFALNYSAQIKRKGAELVMYSPKVKTEGLRLGVG